MRHLKFYISRIVDKFSLNSCVDTEDNPPNFVEWFNKDDWEYMPPANSFLPDGTMNLFSGHFVRKDRKYVLKVS